MLRKMGARSFNHGCSGKAISITYSVCVFVAFVIQYAKRMRRIILSSVARPALPLFSNYLINGTILKKENKIIEHRTRVLIVPTTSVRNISHPEKNSARYYHDCILVFM